MPLADVKLACEPRPLPPEVAALIEDARRRIERFTEASRGFQLPGFVPSDFVAVYQALRCVQERGLAAGSAFLEWGSGFGVVACLAASLGYAACGIEIEPALVEEARALAADHSLPVEFACGTFIPEGGEPIADQTGEFAWLLPGGADGYEEIGLDASDFDLIFCYPWPGEEQVVERLFDRFGAEGALFLTYRGEEEMRAQRRKPRR